MLFSLRSTMQNPQQSGMLAAGGLLPLGNVIGPNELWAGSPAKLRRVIDEAAQARFAEAAQARFARNAQVDLCQWLIFRHLSFLPCYFNYTWSRW